MAVKKTAAQPFSISRAELAKMSRNDQRRFLDLGYVQEPTRPAPVKRAAPAAKAKAP